MKNFTLLFFLLLSLNLQGQQIKCWLWNDKIVILEPKWIRIGYNEAFRVESYRFEDPKDLFNFEFVTANFKYRFFRRNGQVQMIVCPKNPYWIPIHDPRNKCYPIKKYRITGKWN